MATYITAYKAAGYDFVKIHSEDSVVAQLVAVAAHRAGIPILGHIRPLSHNAAVAMQQAVRLGYTSIEHYDQIALDTGVLATVRRAGVWIDPTLAYNMSDASVALGTEMQYVPPNRLAEWADGQAQQPAPGAGTAGQPHGWLDSVGHSLCQRGPCRVVRALRAAGVGLLSGTDVSDNLWMFGVPGFALHRELAALVFAGLTPYEALATSTRNAAASLGILQENGTISVGKRADLVLLAGNPLEDILATTRIAGVMLGGRWLSRTALDRRLAAERAAVATADYGRPFDYGPRTRRPRRQP